MQEFPYLYGQLLKVSDEMHILYCRVERDGDFLRGWSAAVFITRPQSAFADAYTVRSAHDPVYFLGESLPV